MKHTLAIGLIAGLAAVAMADKTIPKTGTATHDLQHRVLGSGGTASGTVYYDNTQAPYGFIWYFIGNPKEILDYRTFTNGPAAGVGGNVDQITFGFFQGGPDLLNFDLQVRFWDNCDLTNSNTPINSGELDAPGVTLEIRDFAPGGWSVIAGLTDLPGGGIDLTDDNDWGVTQLFLEPGSPSVVSDQGTFIFDYDNIGPLVGTNEDFCWIDTFGNGDGVYDPSDNVFAGGGPFYTALWLALEGDAISACDPCDADCNGSINGQDIQPFINVLNGGAGCAPCTGDADGNGSVNGQDIQAFIACLTP